MSTSKIIGIDLGTTNSCVAVIEGGVPVVIPNSEGMNTTPSVVSFDQAGARLIGLPAKRQAIKHPERTIQSIKRYMGTNHRVQIDHMAFSPEQISASVLQKLKQQAQTHLGEKITKAIVTVPAYFDDAQRLATRHAGEIAGLEVIRVMNEPTACALAYGFVKMNQQANIVIFDYGGGTFDVTILQLAEGVLQVKSTNGNNRLGGDDFDLWICDWIKEKFKAANGKDLSDDPVAMQRLKEAAEKAKVELSGMPATTISLPFLSYAGGDPLHFEAELTQKEFNAITLDLVEATSIPIERALRDAKMTASQIDHVVLAGGTTRIPAVQQMIRKLFNKDPIKSVNPDEAVAIGAAIQGGILTGEVQDALLLDVIPLTLGVEESGGRFGRIIERNTTIPLSRKKIFPPPSDGHLSIHILQGESEVAKENTSLARFEVENIPAGQQVEVTFDVDADGIVHCSTAVGGKTQTAVVLKRTAGFNQGQIDQLKKDEALLALQEQRAANKIAATLLAETSISEAESLLQKLPEDKAKAVQSAVSSLKAALPRADTPELEFLRRKLEESVKLVKSS